MARTLQAGTYLVAALLVTSLLMLLAGLGMAARPEAFEGLGLRDTDKTGMVVALVGGIGVIASAVLRWILDLIRGSLDDQDGSIPR